MKAIILAAGLGTRLLPITNNKPKVMVSIGGKPLLWYHIQLLKYSGIKDIWINLHSFPDKVKNYFKDGSQFGVNIYYSFEPTLLGTAGSLTNPDSKIKQYFSNSSFLVIYGDNLTSFNYQKLMHFHKEKGSFMSIGLYRSEEPWTKGVIYTNSKGKIIQMIEKPPKDQITTNQVNTGIYVCEKEVLNFIPSGFSDFGFNIIPELIKKKKNLYAYNIEAYIQDIGTHMGLKKARKDFKKIKFIF